MNLEQIAKKAGVSKSAVSFALNGKPGIGAETRERILRIAGEFGYLPKARAAGAAEIAATSLTFLAFANSGIVLEQYYQQPFFRELIHFIEERCRTRGYSLLFSTIDMSSLEKGIRTIAEDKRSDGVILLGTNLSPQQIEHISSLLGPRLVVLDTYYDTLPVHFVGINNYMGAYQAGKHLCESGHRRFGYLSSNVRIPNFEERRLGFTAALREYGLSVRQEDMFTAAPTLLSSQEELRMQLQQHLLSGRALPSALFCECDYMAISALKTMAELGIRVPDEVSVVGFDNITEAMIVSPELTTVHVEKERMAQLAVDVLIESLEREPESTIKTKVDTRLIERLSSGPLATGK
jgi:LacI family transcriptional regulator